LKQLSIFVQLVLEIQLFGSLNNLT